MLSPRDKQYHVAEMRLFDLDHLFWLLYSCERCKMKIISEMDLTFMKYRAQSGRQAGRQTDRQDKSVYFNIINHKTLPAVKDT